LVRCVDFAADGKGSKGKGGQSRLAAIRATTERLVAAGCRREPTEREKRLDPTLRCDVEGVCTGWIDVTHTLRASGLQVHVV
jgi:hypothetical protein